MDHLRETEHENQRIVLDVLNLVESGGARSQRPIAAELGVGLSLVNAYPEKSRKVQDRRPCYAYDLAPQGFAEKPRVTVQYLSGLISFSRNAKDDFALLFKEAELCGYERLAAAGKSVLRKSPFYAPS